jgi:hypothetical protein
MNDFKPNSHRFKEEQKESAEKKKVEKVISGKVKTKKKSEISKFADVFISEDASNVKSYIFMDVLVPAIKKAISDIVTDGIDMILYGETGRTKKRSSSNSSYISYNRYSDRRDDRRNDSSYRAVSRYDFENITLDNRGDAEEVLERMDELLDAYGIVTVSDLYDLVGITGEFTDNKYGWTSLRNAEIVRVRDGYKLKLPRVTPV